MGQLTAADLRPDLNVLGVMIALAVISTLLLGLAPAVRATGAGMYESMKQGRSSSPRFPLRSLLLGGQAAISVTLLVGAALLVRGLSLARSLDRGFKIDGVTAITAQLPSAAYNEERRRAFYDDIVEAMKPYGAVGFGTSPLGVFKLPFTLTDEKTAEARLEGRVVANGGYFDVLGIAIAAGRNFIPSDRQAHKIIVNEAMARRYWLGQSPIGKAIFFGGERLEIVGMARDCRFTGFGGDIEPAYFSHSDSFGVLLVPASLASIASSVARQLEPRVKLTASPLSVTLERLIAPAKRATLVAGMLGALALLLATVGVFGVMSYSVEQRRREIGIRMALGASRVEVLKSAFRYHIRPLVLGSAVGLAASLAASKVLVSLLYGLNRIDALAYGGAVAVMLAAGAAATVMPALRACRIDAAETLRYD
jgi:predicted permease